APVQAGERRAEHLHRARARREQAGGHVQQRALAAARGADDRDELAGRDVAHGGERRRALAGGEGTADALEAQRRRRHVLRAFAFFAKSFVHAAARSTCALLSESSTLCSARSAVAAPSAGNRPSGDSAPLLARKASM